MDVKAYLSRFGCKVPAEPTLDTLRSMHIQHLRSVPFENLTFHSGGRIKLDLQVVYDKIVNQHQGGCCFENNMLFKWLLTKLGYQVVILGAQVKSFLTGCFDPPFSHMVLLVTLDGQRWLCDVGYGVPGFFSPMSLETSDPQEQGHRVYRIRLDNRMHFLEWQKEQNNGPDGDWFIIYKFTLQPRCWEDFTEMCEFHQSSPHSMIFSKSLCTVHTPGGKMSYVGNKLTITTFPSAETGGVLKVEAMELKDEEIPQMLDEKFGIRLNSPLVSKDDAVLPHVIMY